MQRNITKFSKEILPNSSDSPKYYSTATDTHLTPLSTIVDSQSISGIFVSTELGEKEVHRDLAEISTDKARNFGRGKV